MAKKISKKKTSAGKPQQGVYSTPQTNPTQFLPLWYNLNHQPEQIVKPAERRMLIQLGRELFAKMPIVTAAILNKNYNSVLNAWQPVFGGQIRNDADKAWIAAAESWLVNDFYPNLNWQGPNFSFNDTLVMTGKDIDVDGGSLMIYRNTANGLPRIELVPVDRIGSRGSEQTVTGGSYDGYKIYDGIVYSATNMPVAYKILGSTPDDDQIISSFSCQYLFDPVWTSAGHGFSRVSYSVTNLMDVKDINELLKITIKNFSRRGVIHSNSLAAAPSTKKITGRDIQRPETTDNKAKIYHEIVNKGGTEYISSLDGSEIKPFNFDRPSPNTEAFIFRQLSEAIASMGWFIELVQPQALNGTNVRLIQDQARKSIIQRQQTLERRAKAIVTFGLANAMQLGLVPKTDNKAWNRWTFNRPAELTVDNGYDNQAQIESLKIGISTKAEICARRGKDWKDVDNQTDIELRALFTRAKALAADFNITEQEAREWLSKRDIEILAPIITQPENDAPGSSTPENASPDDSPDGNTT